MANNSNGYEQDPYDDITLEVSKCRAITKHIANRLEFPSHDDEEERYALCYITESLQNYFDLICSHAGRLHAVAEQRKAKS